MYLEMPPMRKKVLETKMPRAMNTTLKPRTKPVAEKKRRNLALPSFLAIPSPPSMLKYEGIRGSTQGEKNESKPAVKTNNNESPSVIIQYNNLYWHYVKSPKTR